MTFSYGDGVGTVSYPAIERFGAASGITLTVTQENPLGSGGFHGTGNAVDFSNGGSSGTPEMDSFAKWWYDYSPYLLELIHTNQDGTGYYVKNGEKVAGSFYGTSIELQHRNHVHVAATNHGIMAAQAGGKTTTPIVAQSATDITAQTVGVNIPGVSQLDDLYQFVTDTHNWVRLAEFIAGMFLLILALKGLAESGKM